MLARAAQQLLQCQCVGAQRGFAALAAALIADPAPTPSCAETDDCHGSAASATAATTTAALGGACVLPARNRARLAQRVHRCSQQRWAAVLVDVCGTLVRACAHGTALQNS